MTCTLARLLIVIAVLLIMSMLFALQGCGRSFKHRTGGIYASMEAGDSANPLPSIRPGGTYTGGKQVLIQGNQGKYTWKDFKPERNSWVYEQRQNISATLVIEDENNKEQMIVERFLVNGVDYPAVATRTDNGWKAVCEYTFTESGRYYVIAALQKSSGVRYVISWDFEYSRDLPTYTGISPYYEKGADGHLFHSGYRIELDEPPNEGMMKLFERAGNWSFELNDDKSKYPLVKVKRCSMLLNSIIIYPSGRQWKSKKANVDFAVPEIPEYSFKHNRGPSWLSTEECTDTNRCPGNIPPEPVNPPPGQVELMPWYQLNEPPPDQGDDCCNPDITDYEIYYDTMCCLPHIKAQFCICRTCTHWVLFRMNTRMKGEGAMLQELMFTPNPYSPLTLADPTEIVDADTPPIWGSFDAGWTGYKTWWPSNGLIQADYVLQIGTFKVVDGVNRWCPATSFSLSTFGDVDATTQTDGEPTTEVLGWGNPDILQYEVIDGATFAAEVENNPSCARWEGNVNDQAFEQLLAQTLEGCGNVLKLHMRDKCFGIGGGGMPPSFQSIPGYFASIPIEAFSEYYWGPVDELGQTMWAIRLGQADSTCAYVCDYSDYQPCTERSNTKQELTYYFLLPSDLNDGYQMTWSNHRQTWVEDDSLYMCFVACDFTHLYVYNTLYRNFHTPLIPITPSDLAGYAKMTKLFDERLHNPVWSGDESHEGYGPTAEDDGPAPFAMARFETCYPPDKITLQISQRQDIEVIGQGIGNAYETADVQDVNKTTQGVLYTGWDDARIKFYDRPPVLFFDTLNADPRPYLHTDNPQPWIMRLNSYEYQGESKGFTIAWDGRQWKWNLGPTTNDYLPEETHGLPFYPPGRYMLELILEFSELPEPLTLNAGTVDLVYGGTFLDGALGILPPDYYPDWLRPNAEKYESQYIENVLYSVWHKEDPSSHSFSPKTMIASNLYSSIYYYDGHNNINFFTNAELCPIRKDLVFIDGCKSFMSYCEAWKYFVDKEQTRVYLGWETNIRGDISKGWESCFCTGLFDLLDEQGLHYTIQQAYDYANIATDTQIPVGIPPIGYYTFVRVSLKPHPGLWKHETGDVNRRIGNFEKTSW